MQRENQENMNKMQREIQENMDKMQHEILLYIETLYKNQEKIKQEKSQEKE
jgi:hypothetical protein